MAIDPNALAQLFVRAPVARQPEGVQLATIEELNAIMADPAQRRRLPAGMRNNNPGNIKYVGQGRDRGVIGPSVNTDQGDPQAVFDSPESGMREMYRLAMRKYRGGKVSANDLIAGNGGWTPGNFQAAANVARTAGIGPGDDIGLGDAAKAARFMRGLMLQEHGPSAKLYDDGMIMKAISGGPGAPSGANYVPGTAVAGARSAAPTSAAGAMTSRAPTGAPQMFGDLVAPTPVQTQSIPAGFGEIAASLLQASSAQKQAEAERETADMQRKAALFADPGGLWGIYS